MKTYEVKITIDTNQSDEDIASCIGQAINRNLSFPEKIVDITVSEPTKGNRTVVIYELNIKKS